MVVLKRTVFIKIMTVATRISSDIMNVQQLKALNASGKSHWFLGGSQSKNMHDFFEFGAKNSERGSKITY